jgi:CBS domain-containing protein
MKVNQIMTAHAHCVAPDNTLVEAAGLMRELDVGALPVCEIDRVAGMVTDRDIVLRGVADGRDANTTLVRDVMSQGAFHIFADQSVEDAARLMEDKQIRRLPVLDRSQRLVGIVSLGDLAVSSNPAFSGIALKEVSLSAKQRMRDQSPRLALRADGSNGRSDAAPRGTRGAKRAGTKARRAASSSRRSAAGAKRKTSARKGRGQARKSARGGRRRAARSR